MNTVAWVEGNPVMNIDASGLFGCSGETSYPAIQSDCNDLDIAMRETSIQIPEISTAVDNEEKIDFEALKNIIQSNFGFIIGGYSGEDTAPLLECTAISDLTSSISGSRPSRFSLVRLATALTYISQRFPAGILGVKNHLGAGATIQLVSDEKIVDDGSLGAFRGIVPLDTSSLNVHLGSNIPMFAIVHELGHLFDKRNNLRPSSLIDGLRIDVNTGEPIISGTNTNLEVTDFSYSSVIAGIDGRANNLADPKEGWADMFMTFMLDGYNFRITPAGDSELRPGVIRWRDEASQNNKRLGFVMKLYTGATLQDLTLGGRTFPILSATDEEKKDYLRPITRTILVPSDNPDA